MIVLHPSRSGATSLHLTRDLAAVAGPMIAEAIARSVRRTGRCRLGLSGGSTPAPVFAYLRAHLPGSIYGQLWVTWTDERHLPLTDPRPGDWQAFDPESNLRLAYEHWLAHVPLPPEHVLPMSLGGAVSEQVVRFGRQFLHDFAGGLDVAVLGVGADGHIASLFPDHPALEVDDLCLAIHDSPKPPADRLSLTLPVLRQTGHVFVLASGAAKADVLLRVWRGDTTVPLGRLQPAHDAHWIVDPAAGAGIVHNALAELDD